MHVPWATRGFFPSRSAPSLAVAPYRKHVPRAVKGTSGAPCHGLGGARSEGPRLPDDAPHEPEERPLLREGRLAVDLEVAKGGASLLSDDAIEIIANELMPIAAMVTPNAPEAEVLTGKAVDGINGQRRAAEKLLEMGAKAALVKGGHVPGDVIVDVLATEQGEHFFDGLGAVI